MTNERRIPAAKVRAVWMDPAKRVCDGAVELGLTRSQLSLRAKAHGLPSRKRVRGQRVVAAEFARMWADDAISNADIANRFGYTTRSLQRIARGMGLPPRQLGPKLAYDDSLLARLWNAGVSMAEASQLFGRERTTLTYRAGRIGLTGRGKGWQPTMTLAQFVEQELAEQMAASARETRAAMAARHKAIAL